MKGKFLLIVLCSLLLQGCSWIVRFSIVNTTDGPVSVEIKLQKDLRGIPIFDPREINSYPCEGKVPDWEKQKELTPDTIEGLSHFKVMLPAHTALEIGRLSNDKYEKYDQVFINDRKFNLERIVLSQEGKDLEIVAKTFDDYFKKGRYGEVYYYHK